MRKTSTTPPRPADQYRRYHGGPTAHHPHPGGGQNLTAAGELRTAVSSDAHAIGVVGAAHAEIPAPCPAHPPRRVAQPYPHPSPGLTYGPPEVA